MPPENRGYMIAAYLIVALVITGYAAMMWRRGNRR